ncbi:MAG: cation diffusion facilitator family transporter, partial [Halobacteriaceae archaeon]
AGTLLYDAATSLLAGPTVAFSYALVGGLAFAVADMAAVYAYTVRVNSRLDSPGLGALATDSRNDVYTSLAAAAGVAGVAAGYPTADAVAGAGVATLVLYEGGRVVRENLRYLAGQAPPDAERERVHEAIRSHPAVEGVHDLRVYYIGTDLEVEFHAEVDGGFTLREAHDIETELNERVRGLEGVGDVHVHLDPSGLGEWKDAPE